MTEGLQQVIKKQSEEIERLWGELAVLQAEKAALILRIKGLKEGRETEQPQQSPFAG